MIYKVVNLARSGSVPLKKELVPVLISPVIINPILCRNFKQTVINTVQLYLPYVLGAWNNLDSLIREASFYHFIENTL